MTEPRTTHPSRSLCELCDILTGCSQFDRVSQVVDFLSKKLRFVVSCYGWTYHSIHDEHVNVIARRGATPTIENEPIPDLHDFKLFCKGVKSMKAIHVTGEPDESKFLCASLVNERLREVMIVPISRQAGINAYVTYYSREGGFGDLDQKFMGLVSEFIHDKLTAIQTKDRLNASLIELAEQRKYVSFRNISLALAHHVNTPLNVASTCNRFGESTVADLQAGLREKRLSAKRLAVA